MAVGLLSFVGGVALAMPRADGGTSEFVYCSGSGSAGTYRIVTCSSGADGKPWGHSPTEFIGSERVNELTPEVLSNQDRVINDAFDKVFGK